MRTRLQPGNSRAGKCRCSSRAQSTAHDVAGADLDAVSTYMASASQRSRLPRHRRSSNSAHDTCGQQQPSKGLKIPSTARKRRIASSSLTGKKTPWKGCGTGTRRRRCGARHGCQNAATNTQRATAVPPCLGTYKRSQQGQIWSLRKRRNSFLL